MLEIFVQYLVVEVVLFKEVDKSRKEERFQVCDVFRRHIKTVENLGEELERDIGHQEFIHLYVLYILLKQVEANIFVVRLVQYLLEDVFHVHIVNNYDCNDLLKWRAFRKL